jgi:hypothetical protein
MAMNIYRAFGLRVDCARNHPNLAALFGSQCQFDLSITRTFHIGNSQDLSVPRKTMDELMPDQLMPDKINL